MPFPDNFELSKPSKGGDDLPSLYTMTNLKREGEVKIRVMSEFIAGNSVWGEKNGKPYPTRARIGDSIPTKAIGIDKETGEPNRIKQFIAAIAWNYDTEQLEVLEIDKITVIEPIMAYEADEDYGDIRNYDLKIKRTGKGFDTTYSVMALPPKDAPKDALEAYEDHQIDLEALFEGEDPFGNN